MNTIRQICTKKELQIKLVRLANLQKARDTKAKNRYLAENLPKLREFFNSQRNS